MSFEERPSIPYIRALDGLRALAILMVLFDHWAPYKEIHNYFEFGRSGLLLFFMLSGYLISTVILHLKDRISIGEMNFLKALKVFYMRRILRILPIYLLAIIIGAILFETVRRDFIVHLFFLQNFSPYWADQMPVYGYATHLWSLAVEEQFYLLWAPVLLWVIDYKKMLGVCVAAIIISLLFKIWITLNPFYNSLDILPRWTDLWLLRLNSLGNIDSLAIGCIIAIEAKYRLINWSHIHSRAFMGALKLLSLALILLIVLNIYSLGARDARINSLYMIFHDAFIQLPFWVLLQHAVQGRQSMLLENSFMVWIGKKSYGIYVWHEFVRYVAIILSAEYFNYTLPAKYSVLSLLIFTVCTFAVAIISWKFVEKPFMRLKGKWT